MLNSLGKYPGKTIHRLGIAIAGIIIVNSTINKFFPVNKYSSNFEKETTLKNIENTISILVLGVNQPKKQISKVSKVEFIMLLKVDRNGIRQILEFPTKIAVNSGIPETSYTLEAAFEEGGVALTMDYIKEIIGIESKSSN